MTDNPCSDLDQQIRENQEKIDKLSHENLKLRDTLKKMTTNQKQESLKGFIKESMKKMTISQKDEFLKKSKKIM